MDARVYYGLNQLPRPFLALLEREEKPNLFTSRAWYENFERFGGIPEAALWCFAVGSPEAPLGLALGTGFKRRTGPLPATSVSIAHPDGVGLRGVVRTSGVPAGLVLDRILAGLAEGPERVDLVKLAVLEKTDPLMAELRAAFRRHGFLTQRYFVTANWFEEVAGASADAYLAARPRRLHEILKSRNRRLGNQAVGQFQMIESEDHLAATSGDYFRISVASWQGRHPLAQEYYPSFLRVAAAQGALRLGLLYVDGRPAAGQICLVNDGTASFYRTAYDPRFRRFSVGTLVIHGVLRHVIDVDRVERIDFGQGDEAYKRQWVSRRREFWGIAGFNKRSLVGLGTAASHLGIALAKAALGRSGGRSRGGSRGGGAAEPAP